MFFSWFKGNVPECLPIDCVANSHLMSVWNLGGWGREVSCYENILLFLFYETLLSSIDVIFLNWFFGIYWGYSFSFYIIIFFFFSFSPTLFIYLFIFGRAGSSVRARALSSCGKRGPLLIAVRGPLFTAVRGPLTIAAPPAAGHRLQTRRLSSRGSRAQPLRGMRDPPRPGLEPVSPALAGRLPTTAPPGKPSFYINSLSKFEQSLLNLTFFLLTYSLVYVLIFYLVFCRCIHNWVYSVPFRALSTFLYWVLHNL